MPWPVCVKAYKMHAFELVQFGEMFLMDTPIRDSGAFRVVGIAGQRHAISRWETIGRVSLHAKCHIGHAVADQVKVSRRLAQGRKKLDFDAPVGLLFNIGGPGLENFSGNGMGGGQPV